jgi:hypothetical protein
MAVMAAAASASSAKSRSAVRDRVERVGGGPVESERGGGLDAVDRERGAGECGGAER